MIRRETRAGRTTITFVLPQDHPTGRVSVVGDFNDWTPGVHTLVKRSNGTRSAKVPVTPGAAYRFRYLAEGGVWFDDPDHSEVDAHGGVLHC